MVEFYVVVHPTTIRAYTSKVYAVDSERDRFLVTDKNGWFEWVDINDCALDEEEYI